MKRNIFHISNTFQRYLFVFATVLLVLFSSCVLKASVKTLAGIPTKTEQGIAKGHSNFPANTVEECTLLSEADMQAVQNSSFNSTNLLPAVIVTFVFLFSFGIRHSSKVSKHPTYIRSEKIPSCVPIFLEYQKLLVYHSH